MLHIGQAIAIAELIRETFQLSAFQFLPIKLVARFLNQSIFFHAER